MTPGDIDPHGDGLGGTVGYNDSLAGLLAARRGRAKRGQGLRRGSAPTALAGPRPLSGPPSPADPSLAPALGLPLGLPLLRSHLRPGRPCSRLGRPRAL